MLYMLIHTVLAVEFVEHSVAKIEFPNGKMSPFFTCILAVSGQQETSGYILIIKRTYLPKAELCVIYLFTFIWLC